VGGGRPRGPCGFTLPRARPRSEAPADGCGGREGRGGERGRGRGPWGQGRGSLGKGRGLGDKGGGRGGGPGEGGAWPPVLCTRRPCQCAGLPPPRAPTVLPGGTPVGGSQGGRRWGRWVCCWVPGACSACTGVRADSPSEAALGQERGNARWWDRMSHLVGEGVSPALARARTAQRKARNPCETAARESW